MDKKKLNNEIILCRPAVRKARVAVVRKILRKMKILKSCKIEALKEKKLQKSQRLFEKVQMIKKLKDDEITKFALHHDDLSEFHKEFSTNLRNNALVSLAKHKAVSEKVDNIRSKFPDWKTELPLMLDSLGKKKLKKKNDKKIETKIQTKKSKSEKSVAKVLSKKPVDSNADSRPRKENLVFSKTLGDNSQIENTKANKELSRKSKEILPRETDKKEEKIDDPFFIEKKTIAPTLPRQPAENKFSKKSEQVRCRKDNRSIMFKEKPYQEKKETKRYDSRNTEEKLHPSWAAKKVTLIKPFEGKKIVFSDE